MSLEKFYHWLWGFFIHVFPLLVIIFFGYPLAETYLESLSIRGIDFFLTVSNVVSLLRRFILPPAGWWSSWFGGRPWEVVYPVFHFYFIYLLSLFFNVIVSVRLYVVMSFILFYFFSYFLFLRLSKNFLIALFSCLFLMFSLGVYLSAFWGGNVPYTATMFFVPLGLFLIVEFLLRQNKTFLLMSGLVSGLGLLGHPQVIVGWLFPLAIIFILFFRIGEERSGFRFNFWSRIKYILIYLSIAVFCGFRQITSVGLSGILDLLFGILGGKLVGEKAQLEVLEESQELAESSSGLVYALTETWDKIPRWINHFFWYGFIFSLVLFLFILFLRRKKNQESDLGLWGSLLIAFYAFIFVVLFFLGLNPFAGGWFRIYWGVAFAGGVVLSYWWGEIISGLSKTFSENLFRKDSHQGIISLSWEIVLSSFFGFFAFLWFLPQTYGFNEHLLVQSHEYPDLPGVLHEHSQESSAYPSLFNLNRDDWENDDVFRSILPDWLNPSRQDVRLFDLDATINIWWNSFFEMPLVRGYLDSPGGENYAGWQYWMNITLSKDEAVERLGVPEEIALRQTKFFLDWHSIGFLEGMGGALGRGYGVPYSTYLVNNDLISQQERRYFWRPIWDQMTGLTGFWESLEFYEISPKIISPIYQATNVPSMIVIGDNDAHNIWQRIAGSLNWNSQRFILVQGDEYIDNYEEEELSLFKAIVLYRYNYHDYDQSWKLLSDYVRQGGVLFVETGDESRESAVERLPDIFPIETNQRESLGEGWNLSAGESVSSWGIDLSDFSEPVFNGEPWNFSFADSVDSSGEILLENYNKVILARGKVGNGSVIWSGMNLPYHILREYSLAELNLLEKLISDSVAIPAVDDVVFTSDFERISPEKVVIYGSDSSAVLFKEAGYSSWQAKIVQNGKTSDLNIYPVGPMEPGYMYVPIPRSMQKGAFQVIFSYQGNWQVWLVYGVNATAIILVLDYILGGRFLKFLKRVFRPLQKIFSYWWGNEGEY